MSWWIIFWATVCSRSQLKRAVRRRDFFRCKQKNYANFLKTFTTDVWCDWMSSRNVIWSSESNDISYFFVVKVFASNLQNFKKYKNFSICFSSKSSALVAAVSYIICWLTWLSSWLGDSVHGVHEYKSMASEITNNYKEKKLVLILKACNFLVSYWWCRIFLL